MNENPSRSAADEPSPRSSPAGKAADETSGHSSPGGNGPGNAHHGGAPQHGSLEQRIARRAKRMKLPRVRRGKPPAVGVHHTAVTTPAPAESRAEVTCIDYSPQQMQIQEHLERDLDRFFTEHRPPWSQVRWINVESIHDHATVAALAKKYELHPLAIEDVLHVPQHPKVDQYAADEGQPPRLFVVIRMLQLADGHLQSEQVSLFLGRQTVLTFQEGLPGDVWEPIRHRLRSQDARLRHNDASFLLYALVDAVVDECFPILDHYGDRLEQLEAEILTNFHRDSMLQVHEIRRELLLLQRQLRPMREVIHSLTRESHPQLSEETRLYLRDVYDHLIQSVEFLETYHELSMNLADMVNSNIANRVNDVMKVLTVIATIFIPISFLAGVFGMNFKNLPGQHWPPAFAVFCAACAAMAGGMLLYFKRKGWL